MILNINRLSNQIDLVNESIKNYEMTIYDTLSIVKNMSYSWQDGWTESYFKNIDIQIDDVNNLIDILNNVLTVLRNIYSNYRLVASMIRGFNGVINTNDFYIYASDDEQTRMYKRNVLNAINNAEDNIAYSILRIPSINIMVLNYNNLNKNNNPGDFIGMQDNMPNEINKFDMKKNSVRDLTNKLMYSLNSTLNTYNSYNANKLKIKIDQINNDLNNINISLDNAYELVSKRRDDIKNMVADLTKETNRIGKR